MIYFFLMQSGAEQHESDETASLSSLVERAKAGEREAFNSLIRLFRQDIFRMVYSRTQSKMDAEDLTQDVFIKAFGSIERLKDSSLFKPWLYRIALNRVRDFYRKRMLSSLFFLSPAREDDDFYETNASGEENALDQVMKKQFWTELEGFLSKIGRFEREVFRLKYVDHLSIPEISTVLDKGESTVKTHLYRAVKKFQSESHLISMIKGEYREYA